MNKELEAHTTLSHYRIVSKIGAGGMGEVPSYYVAIANIALGEKHEAFIWLERDLNDRGPNV